MKKIMLITVLSTGKVEDRVMVREELMQRAVTTRKAMGVESEGMSSRLLALVVEDVRRSIQECLHRGNIFKRFWRVCLRMQRQPCNKCFLDAFDSTVQALDVRSDGVLLAWMNQFGASLGFHPGICFVDNQLVCIKPLVQSGN